MTKQHHKQQPIGVFDSGIGGLTVANAIIRQLPNEELIYFGDTAHLPYGDKSADAIRFYCLKIVKFLLDRNCKMVVIACNSASAAAYDTVVEFFKDQAIFVNVIDPLVDAVTQKQYRKIGVVATKATTRSGVYQKKLTERQRDLEVASLATPLLAPMIEEGYVSNNISNAIISEYLSDPLLDGMEALLLACTHYPLIRKDIETFLKGKVAVFDSTDVVARSVEAKLAAKNLLNDKNRHPHQFYVSDYTASFEETTRLFYHEPIQLDHFPIW